MNSSVSSMYVLKVHGRHNLTFKTKHPDEDYLKKVAEQLITAPDSHFTTYEIKQSNQANDMILSSIDWSLI